MGMNKRIAIEIIIAIILILGLYLFIAAPREPSPIIDNIKMDSGYRLAMGTVFRVVAVAPDPATADKAIWSACEQLETIDGLMSGYKGDSEISRINLNAYHEAVKVSKLTFEVIQKALYFSKLTNGAFDITVGPVEELWHLAEKTNSVPSEDELAEAREKVGYEKLLIDVNEMTVRFTVEGMKLDVGGIAKGYAIDKAVEAMQKCGATGAMVDIGGDIRCFGSPDEIKKFWTIGLQDPSRTNTTIGSGEYSLVLRIKDAAVATSGDYRRFVLIEGRKYSHIIDTKTGYGSSKLSSATVICPKAVDADALTTSVSVMGKEKGLELIKSLDNTEAILISPGPEYDIVKTKKAGRYILKK